MLLSQRQRRFIDVQLPNNDRAHTVNILPSIDENGTYELLLGTKFGKVICFSGGVGSPPLRISRQRQIARTYSLEQNYPNPFNPVTRISFTLPRQATVTLRVFNLLGQEVATLLDRQQFTAGAHFAEFDGKKFASGIYLYQLSSEFGVLTRRMILMK
ncbi:MAG TPA: T9SS type A sorting domain-containing protein [Caldithrix sp.]|nr:T9SS type A sorting domain-containing protein [Caldithrix sp.]